MSEEITPEMIGEVLAGVIASADIELYAKQENELEQCFYWRWEEGRSVEWNTYKFSDLLEMYKRQCRRWEQKHNGSRCVVERVRDKYVMPKVREFLAELARHNSASSGAASVRLPCVVSRSYGVGIMNPQELNEFLKRNKMAGKDLAVKLGVHWTTVSRWRNGREPIPKAVELALKWIGGERQIVLK